MTPLCFDAFRDALRAMDRAGGGTMLGVSRTVRNGRTVEFEFVVIRTADDGTVVYHAHPSGQLPTEFRLLHQADGEVVFENAAHDFPQRVGYRLENDGALTAWIEGSRAGALNRIPFPMRRVSCDSKDPQAPTRATVDPARRRLTDPCRPRH